MRIKIAPAAACLAIFLATAGPAVAQVDSPGVAAEPAYADLVDLAEAAPLVIRAQPRKLAAVEAARAPGLRPGWGRFYIEARTEAVIFGRSGLGEQLRYLVDLPLDPKGKPPAIKKRSMVLFARAVPARPGELQLVAPDAQVAWNEPLDARLRAILAELTGPGAPLKVTGVREALFVPGNLAGESETQLFLATANDQPAAITVVRRPGAAPRWTVSFSDVVGEAAAPPRETLAWYRLACFLPPVLPAGTASAGSAADRAAAARDYRFVIAQLGACGRTRKPG